MMIAEYEDLFSRLYDISVNVEASQESERAAILGLIALRNHNVVPPRLMYLESEEAFGCYWRDGKNYLSIDFHGDMQFTWCSTDGSNIECECGIWEKATGKTDMPQELLEQLPRKIEVITKLTPKFSPI